LYDPSASNECRSRTTEPVKDKDKRNFCDEFDCLEGAKGNVKREEDDMNKKWNDLFK